MGKRVYRPIKPVVSPLIEKIKMWHVFSFLVMISLLGSLVNGFRVSPKERAGFWPWSSKSHSQMALAWFEAGDEERALLELEIANKLFFVKTNGNEESLLSAREKVMEPERLRTEIKEWEVVLEKMPSFRDVYLRLAVLNYQLYEDEKAREYFEKAEYLDPNSLEVLEIKKIIF